MPEVLNRASMFLKVDSRLRGNDAEERTNQFEPVIIPALQYPSESPSVLAEHLPQDLADLPQCRIRFDRRKYPGHQVR